MEENRKILNSMSYIEKKAFIFLTQLGFKRNRVLAAVFFVVFLPLSLQMYTQTTSEKVYKHIKLFWK